MTLAMVPMWITAPAGAVLVLALLWHTALMLRRARTDGGGAGERVEHRPHGARCKIRIANNVVMMLIVVLLVAGLSLVQPKVNPSLWVNLWLGVLGLLILCIGLAIADAVNTAMVSARERVALREVFARPASPASASADAESPTPPESTAPDEQRAPMEPSR